LNKKIAKQYIQLMEKSSEKEIDDDDVDNNPLETNEEEK
jgi:hypothetical protein